jgi:hypothetical protein
MAGPRLPLWSRMTRGQRTLLVTVVAIAALSATSAAVGARGGAGTADPGHSGVVAWLGRLVGGPRAVARADLSADCLLADGRITVRGACALHVAPRRGELRAVRLHVDAAMTVSSRPPNSTGTVSTQVGAGRDISVIVDGVGGDVTLDCAPAAACAGRLD